MCYGGAKPVLTWYFSFVEENNGYILVTANGGMNQQRVAVSNALTSAAFMITPLQPSFIVLYATIFASEGSDMYFILYHFKLLQTCFYFKNRFAMLWFLHGC